MLSSIFDVALENAPHDGQFVETFSTSTLRMNLYPSMTAFIDMDCSSSVRFLFHERFELTPFAADNAGYEAQKGRH